MGQLSKQEILFPFHRVEPLQQQPEGLCHQSDDNGTGEKDEQGEGISLGWNGQTEARLDEQEHRQKGAKDSRVETSPAIQQQSGERHDRVVYDEHVTRREEIGDPLHHCYCADDSSAEDIARDDAIGAQPPDPGSKLFHGPSPLPSATKQRREDVVHPAYGSRSSMTSDL